VALEQEQKSSIRNLTS